MYNYVRLNVRKGILESHLFLHFFFLLLFFLLFFGQLLLMLLNSALSLFPNIVCDFFDSMNLESFLLLAQILVQSASFCSDFLMFSFGIEGNLSQYLPFQTIALSLSVTALLSYSFLIVSSFELDCRRSRVNLSIDLCCLFLNPKLTVDNPHNNRKEYQQSYVWVIHNVLKTPQFDLTNKTHFLD